MCLMNDFEKIPNIVLGSKFVITWLITIQIVNLNIHYRLIKISKGTVWFKRGLEVLGILK